MWSVLTTGSQNFWPEGAVSVSYKWHVFTYYLWFLMCEEDERSFTCQSKQSKDPNTLWNILRKLALG